MPSLSDVARLADVSMTTASKILNTRRDMDRFTPECISRVHEAARQISYVPNLHAQRLREGKTHIVGVPLETIFDDALGNPYFSSLLNGIRFCLAQAGYAMTVFSSTAERSATTESLRQLRQGGLDGVVIPGTLHRLSGRVWSETSDLPIVMIEPKTPMPFPCLDMDFGAGIQLILKHLAGLGHQRVLWYGPDGERHQTFGSAAWQLGFQGRSCLVERKPGRPSDLSRDTAAAERDMTTFLDDHDIDFTAVVCWNDTFAAGAVRALRQAGLRIPTDVSVTGFDDFFAGVLDPPLTTISHRLYDMGHRAAELLLARLANPGSVEDEPGVELLQPELVVRQSTTAASPGNGN